MTDMVDQHTASKNAWLNDLVEVALDLMSHIAYTYRVPDDLRNSVTMGSLVLVPVGKREMTGVVVGAGKELKGVRIKVVSELLDEHPVLYWDQVKLARWIADYYLTPLGGAVTAMLPAGIDKKSIRIATLINRDELNVRSELLRHLPDEFRLLEMFRKDRRISVSKICKRLGDVAGSRALLALEKSGMVVTKQVLVQPRVKPKKQSVITLQAENLTADVLDKIRRRAPAQFRAVRYLEQNPKGSPRTRLLVDAKVTPGVIKGLESKGLIEVRHEEVERSYPLDYNPEYHKPSVLTPDQQGVVDTIGRAVSEQRFESFLLHGVTGSGKTQVYIELVQKVLQAGRSALLLVPEISLTSQAVSRLRTYFADSLAFLHSRMSPGEKYDAWRRIRSGDRKLVIGPRSAVFAPLENLGVVIVDEEHDDSYKQQDNAPRYHARDVAVMRGKICNCPVVLGSATPSLEAYHNAQTGKFTLTQLPKRIDDTPMPLVRIVNMQRQQKKNRILSSELAAAVTERIEGGEQVVLLQNRRGFSSFVQCKTCGFVVRCDNCHVTLTYHKAIANLRCHYCGHARRAPEQCPDCKGKDLQYRGIGTQQVEEELSALSPKLRVIRMDADTTTQRGSHGRIVSAFEQGHYNVLLGTQMVAKGFDFPNVNLVGVISAETSLLMPDFRASERTFQLLTQLAGRAGRRKTRGAVYIQTYMPEHYSVMFAIHHDYLGFQEVEQTERRQLQYPPFGRFAVVRFSGESEQGVQRAAEYMYRRLKTSRRTWILYDPAPAPISKIRKRFRWQVLLKSTPGHARAMRRHIDEIIKKCARVRQLKSIAVSIDIDPTSLM
jgi:primosomal protein N' (replication factor Y) (superfamily II helicase)